MRDQPPPTFSRCRLSSGTLECISLEAKPEALREDWSLLHDVLMPSSMSSIVCVRVLAPQVTSAFQPLEKALACNRLLRRAPVSACSNRLCIANSLAFAVQKRSRDLLWPSLSSLGGLSSSAAGEEKQILNFGAKES